MRWVKSLASLPVSANDTGVPAPLPEITWPAWELAVAVAMNAPWSGGHLRYNEVASMRGQPRTYEQGMRAAATGVEQAPPWLSTPGEKKKQVQDLGVGVGEERKYAYRLGHRSHQ